MSLPFASDVVSLGGAATSPTLQPGAADPSSGGGVVAALGSFYYQTSTSLIWQKVGSADTAWVPLTPRDLFGDGSDGALTVAGTVTLTRDTYYTNLTVPAGQILQPGGCRIWVRGTLTVDVGGIIRTNGVNASGSSGGGAVTAAVWGSSSGAGGNGTATNGNAGTNRTECIPGFTGSGGAGGAGSGGTAGGGGTVTAAVANRGTVRNPISGGVGNYFSTAGLIQLQPGAGGGAGGGDGGTAGRGGGSGAGGIFIFAREVVNNGTISANGGAGATLAAAGIGGGGGGGGGVIIIGFHAFSGSTPTVLGGAGGAGGGGGGLTGSDGNPGIYIPLQL